MGSLLLQNHGAGDFRQFLELDCRLTPMLLGCDVNIETFVLSNHTGNKLVGMLRSIIALFLSRCPW